MMEENMCNNCKSNVLNCLEHGSNKRQKTGETTYTNGQSKVNNFVKVLLGFIAVIGVICVVIPFYTKISSINLS